jgi:hypothetical protein
MNGPTWAAGACAYPPVIAICPRVARIPMASRIHQSETGGVTHE